MTTSSQTQTRIDEVTKTLADLKAENATIDEESHDATVEMCRFGYYCRCKCGWSTKMYRLDQYARDQKDRHTKENRQ